MAIDLPRKLNYPSPPLTRRKPREHITPSLLRELVKDPLKCLYRDILFCAGPKRYELDRKTGVVHPVSDPKGGNLQPFFPNFEQHSVIVYRRICMKMKRPTSIISVKARRVGMSTISQAIILCESMFQDGVLASTVTLDPGNQKAIYGIMRSFLMNLPPELLPSDKEQGKNIKRCSMNEIYTIVNEDGPRPKSSFDMFYMSAEKGDRAGVGSGNLYLHLTEYAKWPDTDAVLKGVGSTMFDTYRVFKSIESTAEGTGNDHYQSCINAWNAQGRCNYWEKGFKWNSLAPETCFFFPWWYSESYRVKLPKNITPSMLIREMTEYESELYDSHLMPRAHDFHGLTGQSQVEYCCEQIYWFRGLNAKLYAKDSGLRVKPPTLNLAVPTSESARKSEFPSYIEEAFSDAVNALLTSKTLDELKPGLMEPDQVGVLDESGCFYESPNGWLRLWMGKGAIKDGRKAPMRLICFGADIAHGNQPDNEEHDKSAIVGLGAFDKIQYLEVDGRIPSNIFGKYVDRVKLFCMSGSPVNAPLACIEYADAGITICQDMAMNYPVEEAPDLIRFFFTNNDKTRYGYDPKVLKLEVKAWARLKAELEAGSITVRSWWLFEQLSTIVMKPDGRAEAPRKGKKGAGSKDDLVDGLKMANWFIDFLSEFGALEGTFPGYDEDGLMTDDGLDLDDLPMLHPRRLDQLFEERQRARREGEDRTEWWMK